MSELDLRMRHPHRAARSRRGRSCFVTLLALAIIFGAIGFAALRGADIVSGWFAGPEDYSGQGSGAVRVEVIEGDSAADIGVTLEEAGVVASAEAFTDAASADPRSRSIQPGRYEMHEQMSAAAALDMLVGGEALIDDDVTIPEGFTVAEIIERLGDETDLAVKDLASAAERAGALGLPAWAEGDVEGFLYPSTYTVDPGTDATGALAAMVEQFRQRADELRLEERAQEVGLTPREVVIVASLVQAEASRPQDFGKVARVIYNRLDEQMMLQLDSTVKYITGSSGVYTTDEERDNPSRYNTYEHEGLPPTAIDSPGERALRAALEPTPGDWMYFVTVNFETGRTLFADSYQQHLRNDAKKDAYCAQSDLC